MTFTVTKTIGAASRQYSTIQSWHNGAPGNLTTAEYWNANSFSGSFIIGETVTGTGLTTGKVLDTNGSNFMAFGISSGNTNTITTLTGSTSGATCTLSSKVDTGCIWKGVLYKDSVPEFTNPSAEVLVVSGAVVNASCYKWLTVAAGDSFSDVGNALAYNTANGVAIRTTAGYSSSISIQEDYFRLSRVQVSTTNDRSALDVPTSSINNVDINQVILEASGIVNNDVVRLRSGTLRNATVINRTSVRGGVYFDYATTGVAIINCTIARPSDKTKTGTALRSVFAGVIVKNCAVFGFTDEVDVSSRYTVTTSKTDKVSPMTGFTTLTYDTTTGSGFKNTTDSTRDFRLNSTSGMIDAGTNDAVNAATDIFGTTRPQGSGTDVGAFEYVAAGASFMASKGRFVNHAIANAANY